jgi:hypothetical protein
LAIALQSLFIRHESRIRLIFSNTLASGAFGVPAPAAYVITNEDGLGVSPSVSAAMVVSDAPTNVELALSQPLVAGARYKVSAVGVPATDLSVTPGGTEELFLYASRSQKDTREQTVIDRERLLYGVDLVWNGSDFEESATGDLARVSGTPNVTKALWYGVVAEGLPWDPDWGGKAREFVDSPSPAGVSLRGSVVSHVLRDPRVESVETEFEVNETSTILHLTPKLKTGQTMEKVSVTAPNG